MKEAARFRVVLVVLVLAAWSEDATAAARLAPQQGPESRSASRPTGAIGLGPASRPADSSGGTLTATRIMRRNALAGTIQATEKAVMAGLDWLQRHQSANGSWSCDGYKGRCDAKRIGSRCEGTGSRAFDPGVTALALLAFFGAGFDSQRPGGYQETVLNGLKYLASIQDAQGCFGESADPRHVYNHACSTMAMCEAWDMTRDPQWRTHAEQGVAYIWELQNPYKGWRYGKKPGDNDTSVTGWMLMALKAARDGGIAFDERKAEDGLAFLDSVTDRETGRTGYIRLGERPVRPEALQGKFPAEESESLTAIGACARMFYGDRSSPLLKAGLALVAKKPPVWDQARGSIDLYYWYYGSMAMFQAGGPDWERWNKSLKMVGIDRQIKQGCAAGSWDPKDAWGDEGGRVYSTALMTMCLEVYYRYPRPEVAKKPK